MDKSIVLFEYRPSAHFATEKATRYRRRGDIFVLAFADISGLPKNGAIRIDIRGQNEQRKSHSILLTPLSNEGRSTV
jgi:hypothetical protein